MTDRNGLESIFPHQGAEASDDSNFPPPALPFFQLRPELILIVYVAVGSAIGGMARYLVGNWLQRSAGFPWGTLAVNITGSFVIGWFMRYSMGPSARPELRALVAIGICGGYTTFSAFSYETMTMMRDGHWARAGAYVGGSVLLSLVAVFAGFAAGREAI